MPTFIVGKDAPLEESITLFRNKANLLNLEIIEHDFLHPLPDVWSIHIESKLCPNIYSNGKGSSQLAALASAYGELFERLGTHMFFSDYFFGQELALAPFVHFKDEKWTDINIDPNLIAKEILNKKLIKFYSKNNELGVEDLVDIQGVYNKRGICSLPFKDCFSHKTVYFPINLLDTLYASNGMSAGNTKEEATVQALSEIIERYVKQRIIKEGLSLPEISRAYLSSYPKLLNTLDLLNQKPFHAICYDASLGGVFPVVCVILFNQDNGTCYAAFGSHPNFEIALDRTLTELLQGRTLKDCNDFTEPSFNADLYADPTNLESHFIDSTGILPCAIFKAKSSFPLRPINFDGTNKEQAIFLQNLIKDAGFSIYQRFYEELNIPICRIIVPGMSEVYPIDDLIYNNNASGAVLTDKILNLNVTKPSKKGLQDLLDELEINDFADEGLVIESLGIIPDDNSVFKTLRFGELKAMLYLALKDTDNALFYINWTLNFNHDTFTKERLNFYRCLAKIIELKHISKNAFKDYEHGFNMLYGTETVAKAQSCIKGQINFYGLTQQDLSLSALKKHRQLTDIYKKLKETEYL